MTSSDPRWPALLRGSVLSRQIYKLMSFIRIADQRAQALVTMNVVLISVQITLLDTPGWEWPLRVALVTALATVALGIVSFFPRRPQVSKCRPNLLHFGDIARFDEDEYMQQMQEQFADDTNLIPLMIRDMHFISRYILRKKYLYLKAAMLVFLVGNAVAVGMFLVI